MYPAHCSGYVNYYVKKTVQGSTVKFDASLSIIDTSMNGVVRPYMDVNDCVNTYTVVDMEVRSEVKRPQGDGHVAMITHTVQTFSAGRMCTACNVMYALRAPAPVNRPDIYVHGSCIQYAGTGDAMFLQAHTLATE